MIKDQIRHKCKKCGKPSRKKTKTGMCRRCWKIGRKHTKIHSKRISKALKGRNFGNKFQKGNTYGKLLKGIKRTEETKKKISKMRKGKGNPNWKGGRTPIIKLLKSTYKYKQWRSDIFERDNWTCQTCRERGGRLHPHHIKAFSKIIKENIIPLTLEGALKCHELWDIDNGITLCEECHKLTDNYGRKKVYS